MPTLVRMVLFDLLKVFAVVLTSITGFMMLFVIGKEAVDQGLGIAQILQMLPFALPEALRFAVPGTVLFAACNVYGRMSGANEIVALKSLGISPMVVLWPVFIFAIALSLATVWLNDLAVSWGRVGIQRVIIESVEEIAYGMLRTQRSYGSSQFAINVREVQGRRLIKPVMSFQGTGDDPAISVSAEEAELRADPAENTLTIVLYNSVIDIENQARIEDPGRTEKCIPLSEASTKGDSSHSPSQLALRIIPDETIQQKQRIRALEQRLAATAAYQMMSGDFASLTGSQWKNLRARLVDARNRLFRLQAEPHRRWANGFSCLCFVLVGAPLAIRLKYADFLTIFFACFLTILLVYYPLLIFGVDRSKSGAPAGVLCLVGKRPVGAVGILAAAARDPLLMGGSLVCPQRRVSCWRLSAARAVEPEEVPRPFALSGRRPYPSAPSYPSNAWESAAESPTRAPAAGCVPGALSAARSAGG